METTFIQVETNLQKSPVIIPGDQKENFVETLVTDIALRFDFYDDTESLNSLDAIITKHLQKFYKNGYGGIQYSDSEYLGPN